MIAGADDQAEQSVRAAFAASIGPSGAAAVIGGGRAPEAVAALVNGTAAHALDYDDNFRPGITHASAVLVPALLAVAHGRAANGRSFVDAYLVGLETQAIVGRGINPAHYTLGWHATSTVGAIGTAAGTAWLMELDAGGHRARHERSGKHGGRGRRGSSGPRQSRCMRGLPPAMPLTRLRLRRLA